MLFLFLFYHKSLRKGWEDGIPIPPHHTHHKPSMNMAVISFLFFYNGVINLQMSSFSFNCLSQSKWHSYLRHGEMLLGPVMWSVFGPTACVSEKLSGAEISMLIASVFQSTV